MKQHEAVIETLRNLGGIATLKQLYQNIFRITDCKWNTKTPFASIRRIVQTQPSIYKIKPGLYGLTQLRKQNEQRGAVEETEKNKSSKQVIDFNHSYYQGMLLELGRMRQLETFVTRQDKNKAFLDKKLHELSSLDKLPSFSYPETVRRCASIDVIWINNRKMPHSFFEVEFSTDFKNSLLKFNDLQDFSARMLVVSDNARISEYQDKLKFSSFVAIKDRVLFLDFDSLSKQYEHQVEQSSLPFIL